MDIFKCPSRTIQLLLRTRAIPYLILDYTKDSITVLINRNSMFIKVEAYKDIFVGVNLKLRPVTDENEIDEMIRQSTKIVWDSKVIDDSTFNELLEAIFHAHEILRSRMIEINNKKGTGFTNSDFDTLARLGTIAKYDKDFWET